MKPAQQMFVHGANYKCWYRGIIVLPDYRGTQ
jgi:hypothetical protein